MAGQASFRVIGAATTRSRGVRFGEISVMNETERAIRTAVQAAQKMANVRVDHVIACFAGAEPRSYGLAGELELQDSVVTEQDVARVMASCDAVSYTHLDVYKRQGPGGGLGLCQRRAARGDFCRLHPYQTAVSGAPRVSGGVFVG